MKLQLRLRALSWSYNAAAGGIFLLFIYIWIAGDLGWWLPVTGAEWNGIFWGFVIYMALLPTARLAWMLDECDEDQE